MRRLVAPRPEDLGLLRPSSLKVWRALVRCRDRQGPADAWFCASLAELSRWARCSYGQTKKALAQLKTAGLVAAKRERATKWVSKRQQIEHADDQNIYLVFGKLTSRSGVDRIEFPAEQWRSFVENGHAIAPRLPVQNMLPNGRDFVCLAEELGTRGEPASIYSLLVSTETETSEKAADAALPLDDRSLIDLVAADDDDEILPDIGPALRCFGGEAPKPTPLGPRSATPYLPPDEFPRAPVIVEYIQAEQVAELKARQVVDGYRKAVAEVYGQQWWHFSKGDLKKSKSYAKLLKCGEAMAEHSVPPMHWAIWRLRWFRANKKFADRPPPVWIVMSAKTVSERAGWFRKEYELPVAVVQSDPVIAEQHMRNREAARRWRGLKGDDVFMFAFPEWYVEKRRGEIAGGCEDPHDCWPTKPGSKYGRIA